MSRYRRNAVFFNAREFTRLDRTQKARIIFVAEQRERASKAKGKRDGIIGQSGLAILRLLLNRFHNAQNGRCDPSYLKLQEISGFCVQTISLALKRLEKAGVLKIVRRLERVIRNGRTACEQISNAYLFPSGSSDSRAQFETTPSLLPILRDPGLETALERLNRARSRRLQSQLGLAIGEVANFVPL